MKLDQTKDNLNLCKILFLQLNSIYRFETSSTQMIIDPNAMQIKCLSNDTLNLLNKIFFYL